MRREREGRGGLEMREEWKIDGREEEKMGKERKNRSEEEKSIRYNIHLTSITQTLKS